MSLHTLNAQPAQPGDALAAGTIGLLEAMSHEDHTVLVVGDVGLVITGPGPDLLIDGATLPVPHPDLYIEDRTVCIRDYSAVVVAGCGAVVIAARDVTCDAEAGATLYLAPGAHLQEAPTGALERADITVVPICELAHGYALAARTSEDRRRAMLSASASASASATAPDAGSAEVRS